MEELSVYWLGKSKIALGWFIEVMGRNEWTRRRQNIVDYFNNDTPIHDERKRIAVYSDWISWYMYLVESVYERPGCGDPAQLNRILIFFATIGNNLSDLKKMIGIDSKIKIMLNEKQNQPDDTLYELAVALLYSRNGWEVEFVKESCSIKTPDLKIAKGNRLYWVECKRLAKTTEYGEKERLEWMKRSKHLLELMEFHRKPVFAKILFKTPVESTPEFILTHCYAEYINSKGLKKTICNKFIDFIVTEINLKNINESLAIKDLREGSAEFYELLTSNYDIHGNYGHKAELAEGFKYQPDNPLAVLNITAKKLRQVYVVKWECIADDSIDRKAKDFQKILSKATNQIPAIGKSIIQIGYETLSGIIVERERESKIKLLLDKFHFNNKDVEGVFFNSMQFLSKPQGFDWAQTTIYFHNESILEDNLLIETPEGEYSKGTHWET